MTENEVKVEVPDKPKPTRKAAPKKKPAETKPKANMPGNKVPGMPNEVYKDGSQTVYIYPNKKVRK